MELTAYCERRTPWWVVTVPEIDGLFTQTRRLDQVDEWVKDAAALLTDLPEDSFEVTVIPRLPEDKADLVVSAKQARERLRRVEDETSRTAKAAAAALSESGIGVRDIGTLLGVSHERASQLARAA